MQIEIYRYIIPKNSDIFKISQQPLILLMNYIDTDHLPLEKYYLLH